MRSILTDSSSPEAKSSCTFDQLMFKIRAISGTRYSSRSLHALPQFLKMPVPTGFPKTVKRALAIIPGEARNQERREKWLFGGGIPIALMSD